MALQTPNPAWPTEFIHARAVATAAKTTYNDAANAVELLRYDITAPPGGTPPAPAVSAVPSATGTSIGGSRGGLIKKLYAMPRATVGSATQLILMSSQDGGATFDLRGSAVMNIYTFATTTPVPYTLITDAAGNAYSETNPLRLAPYEKLYFGIAVALAGGIVCHAEGDGYA